MQPGYEPHSHTPFIPERLDKVRTFASKSKTYGYSKDLITKINEEIVQQQIKLALNTR